MGLCSSPLCCSYRVCTVFHTSPSTPTNGSGTGKAGAMRPTIGSPKIKADGREGDKSTGSGFGCQKRRDGSSPSFSLSPKGLGSGNEGQELVCPRKEGAKAAQSNDLVREEMSVDADELDAEEGDASWICNWGNEVHPAYRVRDLVRHRDMD
jgi:hypothetical protein